MPSNKEFRFECIKCGNCCSDKNTFVNITYIDILRIQKALTLSIDELLEIIGFYIFKKELSVEELKKMVVPPIKTERGLAFIGLNRKSNGFCYFYDEKGKRCMIYILRPKFCRTFPFSFRILFDKTDRTKAKIELYYTEKGLEYCPGINQDSPLIKEDEWIKLGKKTIENMNDNNILIEKWNDAVKNGRISPSAKNFILTVLNLEKKVL